MEVRREHTMHISTPLLPEESLNSVQYDLFSGKRDYPCKTSYHFGFFELNKQFFCSIFFSFSFLSSIHIPTQICSRQSRVAFLGLLSEIIINILFLFGWIFILHVISLLWFWELSDTFSFVITPSRKHIFLFCMCMHVCVHVSMGVWIPHIAYAQETLRGWCWVSFIAVCLKTGSLAGPETWKLAFSTSWLACELSGSDCLHAKVLGSWVHASQAQHFTLVLRIPVQVPMLAKQGLLTHWAISLTPKYAFFFNKEKVNWSLNTK